MEYANIEFAISFHGNVFGDGFPEMKTIPNSEITCTVASLKSKNSSGYDGIKKNAKIMWGIPW